jgi:SAM-dependent methyltransferase
VVEGEANMMEEAKSETCPICGRTGDNLPIEHGKDYAMYRCHYCDGDFAEALISLDYKRQTYCEAGDPYLDQYRLAVLDEPDSIAKAAKSLPNFKRCLQFLRRVPQKGILLDVGCGIGVFARLVEELGFEAYAFDPAEEATRYAREKLGLRNVITGMIDDLSDDWRDFAFVTALEVLNHVDQPHELVRKVLTLLAPGGYFLATITNRERLSVRLGRREGWDYPPHHLTRWSRKVAEMFLNDLGFTNVTVEVDGITGSSMGTILLPKKINDRIISWKLRNVERQQVSKEQQPSVANQAWKFVQAVANVAVSPLQWTVGSLYGEYLIAFAQKR